MRSAAAWCKVRPGFSAVLPARVRWVGVLLHVFVLVDERAADILVMLEMSNLVSHPLGYGFLVSFHAASLWAQRGLLVHMGPVY